MSDSSGAFQNLHHVLDHQSALLCRHLEEWFVEVAAQLAFLVSVFTPASRRCRMRSWTHCPCSSVRCELSPEL